MDNSSQGCLTRSQSCLVLVVVVGPGLKKGLDFVQLGGGRIERVLVLEKSLESNLLIGVCKSGLNSTLLKFLRDFLSPQLCSHIS